MMEVHVCDSEGNVLRAFAIGDSPELIVGRDDSCDIQLRSKAVSREHCVIEQSDGELYLRDLDSTSGTIVQGEKIDRIRIQNETEANVGPAVLKFSEVDI